VNMQAALAKFKGMSASQYDSKAIDSVTQTLNEVSELPDLMTVLEKRFGFANFRAVAAEVNQLASTRLTSSNLEFTETFIRKGDPMVMMRDNIDAYLGTYRTVTANIDRMTEAVKQMDLKQVDGFLRGNIQALEEYQKTKGAKDVVTIDGRPVQISTTLKTLREMQKQVMGSLYAPFVDFASNLSVMANTQRGPDGLTVKPAGLSAFSYAESLKGKDQAPGSFVMDSRKSAQDKLLGQIKLSRDLATEDLTKNTLSATLAATEFFKESTRKQAYGPTFNMSVENFQETIQSLRTLGAELGNGDYLNSLNKLSEIAPKLRFDTTGMTDFDQMLNLPSHLASVKQLENAVESMIATLVDSGKGGEGAADALKVLKSSLTDAAQATYENTARLKEYLEVLSLNRAWQNADTQVRAIELAQSRELRVGTEEKRNAYGARAMSSDMTGYESFAEGFSSQMMLGDDFLNLAREGIQIAAELDQAFGNALGNIVMGVESVEEAFRNMAASILESMARIFAQKAATLFITNMMGSFAGGGVETGSSYVGYSADAVGRLASGGYIGRGSGTKDDVPALLMNGEYVLNKRAVAMLGKENLDAWNFGRAKGMSTGGSVGTNYSLPELSANTVQNQYNFGDVVYNSKGGSDSGAGGMSPDDMRTLQRQHKMMTIQLIEDHERRKRRAGM